MLFRCCMYQFIIFYDSFYTTKLGTECECKLGRKPGLWSTYHVVRETKPDQILQRSEVWSYQEPIQSISNGIPQQLVLTSSHQKFYLLFSVIAFHLQEHGSTNFLDCYRIIKFNCRLKLYDSVDLISVCPRTINSLPAQVPEPMTCSIPDYCTGIDCCAELPVLGLGLRSYVFLDLERLEIRYGMENVERTVKIADYTWGKQ